MVRDGATRWNSTAELLRWALQLHEAINLLVISEQHNRSRSAHLKCFQLTKPEWDILDKLFPLLEVFILDFICGSWLTDLCSQVLLLAMQQISQSKTPLVHEVIPVFDIITRALNDHLADVTLPPAIQMAAARGRTMLNKHYRLTDDSIVYRITMCMSSHIHNHITTNFPTLQCCILDIRHHTSTKQDGLVSGLAPLKAFCMRSGSWTISQWLRQSRTHLSR